GAGAAVHLAVGHARTRLGVALGLVLPELLAVGRVEAVEPAAGIAVEAFADVEPAVGQARRRQDLLHPAVVGEGPQQLARGALEPVDGAERPVEGAGERARGVDALAVDQRPGVEAAAGPLRGEERRRFEESGAARRIGTLDRAAARAARRYAGGRA